MNESVSKIHQFTGVLLRFGNGGKFGEELLSLDPGADYRFESRSMTRLARFFARQCDGMIGNIDPDLVSMEGALGKSEVLESRSTASMAAVVANRAMQRLNKTLMTT